MYLSQIILISCVLVKCVWGSNDTWDETDLKFPPWFKFGASTAAYQVEGGWNVSDKTPSIWDVFAHGHNGIPGDANGDVACDSYHLWREDVKMAADLGLHFYRFSISWPRLLPSGFPNRISEDGRRYYSDLIDGLLAVGVEPLVTIYHWDIPQSLQDLGGWTNPLVSDWFADFARTVFSLYADRVKTWITINEPLIYCDTAYILPTAPNIISPEIGVPLCKKHVLVAHAKAWRIYDKEFRSKYHGKLSLSNQIIWFEADREEDEGAAELARQYGAGMYSHPIYSKEGGWPPVIEKLIAENSRNQGYPKSRLPALTKQEIELIRGTYDFYAYNYYTSRVARWTKPGETAGSWPFYGIPEFNITFDVKSTWQKAPPFWFYIYPEGLRLQIKWLKEQYGDLEVLITECGVSDSSEGLHDLGRVDFHKKHLDQILLLINEDRVNVTGYTIWTLMDDFEWIAGYESQFGIYAVDFADPLRRRTPRSSAYYYKNVIKTRSTVVPQSYTPYTSAGGTNRVSYTTVISLLIIILNCIQDQV